MAKAHVHPGICGMETTVTTEQDDDDQVVARVESPCPAVRELAENLPPLDPFEVCAGKGEVPLVWSLAARHLPHPACPVPCGLLKAVEIEAGLALPKDVTIRLER